MCEGLLGRSVKLKASISCYDEAALTSVDGQCQRQSLRMIYWSIRGSYKSDGPTSASFPSEANPDVDRTTQLSTESKEEEAKKTTAGGHTEE